MLSEVLKDFCKRFTTIQNDKPTYISFRDHKQKQNEKIEDFYSRMNKLFRNFREPATKKKILLSNFRARLLPHLQLAVAGLLHRILVEHMESAKEGQKPWFSCFLCKSLEQVAYQCPMVHDKEFKQMIA